MSPATDARGERPVIFSAQDVIAAREGRKTQMRRIAKLYPSASGKQFAVYPPEELIELEPGEFARGICHYLSTDALSGPWDLPYAVGQRLWVKEATRRAPDLWVYEADGAPVPWPGRQSMASWTRDTGAAMYLPRAASRLTLIVEAVKVERFQDISEEDAVAEGVWNTLRSDGLTEWRQPDSADFVNSARFAFGQLWQAIHGPDAWAANSWVAAISFRVIPQNIDSLTDTPPLTKAENRGAADQGRGGGL